MRFTKAITAVALMALIIAGCSKDTDTAGNSSTDEKIGPIPASFTKKVVLEKYTGEWCVNCPDGAKVLKEVIDAHPGKVLAAEVHWDDWLEIPQFDVMDSFMGGIIAFPSASISRVHATQTNNPNQNGYLMMSRGNWPDFASQVLQEKAKIGLALETKLNGNNLDIKVLAASKEDIDMATHLTVYLLEDGIVAKNQIGADSGSNYTHYHVLREVVSDGLGDAVDLSKAGSSIVKEYKNVDLSAYKASNVKVLAFVHVMPDANDNTRAILNGQAVKAGKTKNWD